MVGVINRVTQLSKANLGADVARLVINTNVASECTKVFSDLRVRAKNRHGTSLFWQADQQRRRRRFTGFAIAERMTAQIRGLNMATKNANDGLSMIATVENAANDVTDMLHRIRELAVQAANGTNSSTDRGYLPERGR